MQFVTYYVITARCVVHLACFLFFAQMRAREGTTMLEEESEYDGDDEHGEQVR